MNQKLLITHTLSEIISRPRVYRSHSIGEIGRHNIDLCRPMSKWTLFDNVVRGRNFNVVLIRGQL